MERGKAAWDTAVESGEEYYQKGQETMQEAGRSARELAQSGKEAFHEAAVKVEKAGAASNASEGEEDYRRHWTTHYQSSKTPYNDYSHAYRFGGTLPYGKDWTSIESQARRQWEQQRAGTWDRFKDAVRYAWERNANRRAA
jgi:hypothetical protein